MSIFEVLHSKINLFLNIPIDYHLLSIVFFLISILFLSLFYKLFNFLIIQNFRKWIGKGAMKYGNLLIKNNLISRFVKLLFAISLSQIALSLPNVSINEYSNLLANLFIIYFAAGILFSVLDAFFDFFKTKSINEFLPLQTIVQVFKLFVIIGGVIFSISFILNKSPLILLSGIGAFSAVIMLVFKDSILNLVAIFQIRLQKSIDIGDWIEMSQYGADGDVCEINLSGIEVINWDKTTTIIPPAAFLSNSFKNYKTMSSTARRIKRSFYIDLNTISFLDNSKIDELMSIPILKDYLSDKSKEMKLKNSGIKENITPFQGKKITNIGTFRKYIEAYLIHNDHISKDQTILVRQLSSSEKGVPIELYCFTTDTGWNHFESVQSDIFDHLFAIAPTFNLKIFQELSGNDFINNNL